MLQLANPRLSGHYDMIYKSSQPYQVQLRQHAVPSVNMVHPHGNTFDMDTISMYFPNSTFANQPPADMWSGIAHQPYQLQSHSSNVGSAYQLPYRTFPNFRPPQEATPSTLVPPYIEAGVTNPTPPSPAFPATPSSPISHDHQHDGIRLSTYVREYERGHHQPLVLETGPFKK
jgi:hypothetical protein